jgi:hypothetical protein
MNLLQLIYGIMMYVVLPFAPAYVLWRKATSLPFWKTIIRYIREKKL